MTDKLEAFKIMKPIAKSCGVTGLELKALIECLKKQMEYRKIVR